MRMLRKSLASRSGPIVPLISEAIYPVGYAHANVPYAWTPLLPAAMRACSRLLRLDFDLKLPAVCCGGQLQSRRGSVFASA